MTAVRQPLALICAISVAFFAAGCVGIGLHEEVSWVGEQQLEYYRQQAHRVQFEATETQRGPQAQLSATTRG
ncbi:MAG TPA: hypothetical protein VFG20_01475, partial [Planctomycetaceae bacterium]|nr:hypothetical protein [Planctomycetaceae bacterium]